MQELNSLKNQFAFFTLVTILFSSMTLAQTPNPSPSPTIGSENKVDAKTVTNLKALDADSIQKKVINEPKFSNVSADQADVDKVLKASDEKFNDTSVNHVLSLTECQKLESIEQVKKCKMDLVKKK